MRGVPEPWSQEQIDVFNEIWARPIHKRPTYSQIAEEINRRAKGPRVLNKNAISGWVHRKGLSNKKRANDGGTLLRIREKAVRKRNAAARIRNGKSGSRNTGGAWLSANRKPDPFKVKPDPADFKPLRLTLIELEDGQCRWPIDEEEGYRYCGHPVRSGDRGQPYCDYHLTRKSRKSEIGREA